MPRPAMLVAMVTAPSLPACATISASRSWFLAFKILCFMPLRRSSLEISSDLSTVTVPIRMGWPVAWRSTISLTIAYFLPSTVENIISA